MRGLSQTTQFAVLLSLVSIVPTSLAADEPQPAPSNIAVSPSNTAQSAGPESKAVAELLGLIEQLDPLRRPIPYVDYHDQAVAFQTDLHRRRRRAGFRKKTGRRTNYDPSRGWSHEGASKGSRSSSRGR